MYLHLCMAIDKFFSLGVLTFTTFSLASLRYVLYIEMPKI